MIRNGEITASEVKRILRNYWWILPIAIIGCGSLGFLLATVLPKRYTSETLVLVDQPTVPTEFVKPVVTEDLNHRLASMQEQILSRTRLQPIIEKFGLYPALRGKVHIEELVDRLRTAVLVKPMDAMPGTGNHSLPGFYVDVTFDNPQTAQQICTEITSMFMQQNTREREQQATQTTSFLSDQLEEAKKKLDAQDQRLAAFKRQYLGSLPEEEQTNLNLLTSMNSQLEANVQALSRAQQDKAFNESLLSQQEANATVLMPGAQNSSETPDQQLNALEDQSALLERREFLRQQLADLEAARASVLAVIADIDAESLRQFNATFEKIAAAFGETFARLFNGGVGKIWLAESSDPTLAGIEVAAQPPGKKMQSLNLLSGGERAMTAVALIFAILRVRPSPFYIFDEIDAALDEANVGRFGGALDEVARSAQTIIITHNKATMTLADRIYGITMGEPGASTVLSLALEKVGA